MALSCANHPQVGAVGKCSRCERPFCLDCLDLETGKPLCGDCLADKTVSAGPQPVSTPPLTSTEPAENASITMDDLKMEVEEPVTQPVQTNPPPVALPAFKPLEDDPLGLFKNPSSSTPSVSDKPVSPVSHSFADLSPVKPFETETIKSSLVSPVPLEEPAPSIGLAEMMKKIDVAEEASDSAVKPAASFSAQDKVSTRDLHVPKRTGFSRLGSFGGALRLQFQLLAAKLRIPSYLLAAILFAVLAAGFTYWQQQSQTLVIPVVDSVTPIHLISLDVSQVGDMDITAFTDIQNHLGNLGFTQIFQMTVPQLPSPNFFDVGLKQDEGTYSEILKMPNQIGPRVSFVTVFTNGVWYSTNGWAGTNQQMDYLVSEFYPDQTPEELYNQHLQGVQKLQTANGWQVQKAGLDRYMADLSDHLRWFLTVKNIPAYQADFASWH